MAFNPGLSIGQILKNADIVEKFKCGNMGGMRRSKTTDTLVIVSDYTKGIYHDKWIGGVLHYTGMGKNGDQDINWAQNATLEHRYFFVEKFYETDFRKITPSAPMGTRIFDLTQVLGTEDIPPMEELAEKLKDETWT